MQPDQGRYSALIRPIHYILDLVVILVCTGLLSLAGYAYWVFCAYIFFFWCITTVSNGFYEVYRFTPLLRILYLLGRQLVLLGVSVFAFFGFFDEISYENNNAVRYIFICFLGISIVKLGIFYLLKKYRTLIGRNYRKVVIVGKNSKTLQLKRFFEYNPVYGYKLKAFFDIKGNNDPLVKIKEFVLHHEIDEIYCSISELSNRDIADIAVFADNNLKQLKFLPDNKDIYSKKLKYQYYGITPILSIRELPIDNALNRFLKRSLDILISLVVILGILSWLTPIVAFFIKRESKGPVFYKQPRNGLSGKPFDCYKYRSMIPNDDREARQVVKNDMRVTKTGLFLRKTSIDELPQFINVLLGDMSVVGPRPHPLTQTQDFAKRIDKFMVRHLVKPGITGLAQVSGYRGEVETESDIKNRLRFDIFYLENWSLLMDLRIIAKTIVQLTKGDSKAY